MQVRFQTTPYERQTYFRYRVKKYKKLVCLPNWIVVGAVLDLPFHATEERVVLK